MQKKEKLDIILFAIGNKRFFDNDFSTIFKQLSSYIEETKIFKENIKKEISIWEHDCISKKVI